MSETSPKQAVINELTEKGVAHNPKSPYPVLKKLLDQHNAANGGDALLGGDQQEPAPEAVKTAASGETANGGGDETTAPAAAPAPVKSVAGPSGQAVKEGKHDIAAYTKAVIEATKEKVWKQTTLFMVPLMPGEAVGSVETASINGYQLNVTKGVMVTIPVAFANLIAESYKIQVDVAGRKQANRDAATAAALG